MVGVINGLWMRRSPTGKCIGWHKLSEEEYQQKLKEYEEEKNSSS